MKLSGNDILDGDWFGSDTYEPYWRTGVTVTKVAAGKSKDVEKSFLLEPESGRIASEEKHVLLAATAKDASGVRTKIATSKNGKKFPRGFPKLLHAVLISIALVVFLDGTRGCCALALEDDAVMTLRGGRQGAGNVQWKPADTVSKKWPKLTTTAHTEDRPQQLSQQETPQGKGDKVLFRTNTMKPVSSDHAEAFPGTDIPQKQLRSSLAKTAAMAHSTGEPEARSQKGRKQQEIDSLELNGNASIHSGSIVEYECNSTSLRTHNTLVKLDFDGNWSAFNDYTFAYNSSSSSSSSSNLRTIVEDNFVESYNLLSSNQCDWPFFRRVQSAGVVMTQVSSSAENQTEMFVFDELSNMTSIVFSVTFACQDCNGNFPLFDAPNSSQVNAELLSVPLVTTRQEMAAASKGSSCTCTSMNASMLDFRAPTQNELQESFLHAILPVLWEEEEPTPLMNVKEVPCSGNISNFTTYAYVDFVLDGSRPLLVQERQALEKSFMDIYNQLSFVSCDEYFRNILEVSLQTEEYHDDDVELQDRFRHLQQQRSSVSLSFSLNNTALNATSTNATDDTNALLPTVNSTTSSVLPNRRIPQVFAVTGQCRGCHLTDAGTFSLFDDALRRKLTNENTRTSDNALFDFWIRGDEFGPRLQRYLEGEDPTLQCICPLVVDGGLQGKLSKSMFLKNYKEEIQELKESGNLKAVVGVEQLQEGQKVTCSEEKQTFTSTVFANVDMEELRLSQKALLEETFRTSYNDLAFSVCDGHFRNVLSVTLETRAGNSFLETRRLQEEYGSIARTTNATNSTLHNATAEDTLTSSNITSVPLRNRRREAVFSVTGSCRNCPVSMAGSFTLFDESFRRQLVSADGSSPRADLDLGERSLQGNGGNVCVCPPGEETKLDSISVQEFMGTFNDRLEKEILAGNLNGTVDVVVDSVIEGQEVDCAANTSQFQSEVFSDLSLHLALVTTEELSVLEKAFQRTYNNLAFDGCDGYFRSIVDVTLRLGQQEELFPSRRLQEATIPTGNVTYALNSTLGAPEAFNLSSGENGTAYATIPDRRRQTVFSITGNCRNCPISQSGHFRLFDDAIGRRRSLIADRSRRRSTEKPNACVCPANTMPSTENSISALEFQESLIEELKELEEEGLVMSLLETATSISEGEQVQCVNNVSTFESAAYTDLGVDPKELSPEELLVLEDSFLSAYNALSYGSCDNFFRVVTDVQVEVNSLVSPIFSNGTTDETIPAETAALFKITGNCRGCKVTDSGQFKLFDFDENLRRGLQDGKAAARQTSKTSLRRNMIEDANMCVCPAGKNPGVDPAQTVEEFMMEFNANVDEAKGTENEVTIDKILAVIEVPIQERELPTGSSPSVQPSIVPSLTPTTQDSSSPTLQPKPPTTEPTPEPTPEPIRQPTRVPTTPRPTPLPTRQPTPQPSLEPALQPTRLPTRQPTPQPSLEPTLKPTPKPSSQPSERPSAECEQDKDTWSATYYMVYTGDINRVSNSDLVQAFTIADASLEGTECSPELISVSIGATEQFAFSSVFGSIITESHSTGGILITPVPSNSPHSLPSAANQPSHCPSGRPSSLPSNQFNSIPTIAGRLPSVAPSGDPSTISAPRQQPSIPPSGFHASLLPSISPSFQPTLFTETSSCPSSTLSHSPSTSPTLSPSARKSTEPSSLPSLSLSTVPSHAPSLSPSSLPSGSPSSRPSSNPTSPPSRFPSNNPFSQSSSCPSNNPSDYPSGMPSAVQSNSPTLSRRRNLQERQKMLICRTTCNQVGTTSHYESPAVVAAFLNQFNSFDPLQLNGIVATDILFELPSLAPSASPSGTGTSPPSVSKSPSALPSENVTQNPSSSPSLVQSLRPSPGGAPSRGPSASSSPSISSSPTHLQIDNRNKLLQAIDEWITTGMSIYGDISGWDVSRVDNFDYLFRFERDFNSNINSWQTSQVTSMRETFLWADNFNQPLDAWDVSSNTDFTEMFEAAEIFNQPLSSWDTGASTSFSGMFRGTNSFNQPIDSWDVTRSINFQRMFTRLRNFNQPLNSWDVSSSTTFASMFWSADDFNRPLNSWDVSSSTTFASMFQFADSFNQSLSSWDTSSGTSFLQLFYDADSFNQELDGFDVSGCTDFTDMFYQAQNFNQPLDAWDVSQGTTMTSMFDWARSFNQPIDSWDVGGCNNFRSMFSLARDFNQSLSSWNVSSSTTFRSMFSSATNFNQPLNAWNVSSATTFRSMFYGADDFNQPLSSWDTSSSTTFASMFSGAENFNQELNGWIVSRSTTFSNMFSGASNFNQPLDLWNVTLSTSFFSMFGGLDGRFNQNLCPWVNGPDPQIDGTENLQFIFRSTGCPNLNIVDLFSNPRKFCQDCPI